MAKGIQRPGSYTLPPQQNTPSQQNIPPQQPQQPQTYQPPQQQVRGAGNQHNDLPEIYISILGGTGSGKTSLISGLISCFYYNHRDLMTPQGKVSISMQLIKYVSSDTLLTVSNHHSGTAIVDTLRLAEIVQSLTFVHRNGEIAFHDGNPDSKSYTFLTCVNSVPVFKLVILDYKGGYIDAPGINASEMTELGDSCAASHAIFVLSDMSKILDQMVDGRLRDQLIWNNANVAMIYQILTEVFGNADRPISTLFLMTKTDMPALREHANLCANNFAAAAELVRTKVFSNCFGYLEANREWPHGIVPISAVGPGAVDENNRLRQDADIRQINIDTALLFCLLYNLDWVIARQKRQTFDAKKQCLFPRFLAKLFRSLRPRFELLDRENKKLQMLRLLLDALGQMSSDFEAAMPFINMPGIDGIGKAEAV